MIRVAKQQMYLRPNGHQLKAPTCLTTWPALLFILFQFLRNFYLTSTSSMSKMSVAFAGITPPTA
jgi:hypothetical protein